MAASFTRPVFIIASPRSGSTLLYETLAKHPDLISLQGESHAVIEHIPALSTVARGLHSNCLDKNDATDDIRSTLTSRFLASSKNVDGSPYQGNREGVRFLEKTPKNALRVPFLHALYPDALFVYLVRQPVPNISSIIDAWRSGKFVTYPQLPGWQGPWSLLLPPGWQKLAGGSVAETAAFQWKQANLHAIAAFEDLPQSQVLSVNYDDLCRAPDKVVSRICDFIGVSSSALDTSKLPLSRYTLSAPAETKWYRHAPAIESVLSGVEDIAEKINVFLERDKATPVGVEPEVHRVAETVRSQTRHATGNQRPPTGSPQRNAPCPCGSGKRYKQCHGKLA